MVGGNDVKHLEQDGRYTEHLARLLGVWQMTFPEVEQIPTGSKNRGRFSNHSKGKSFFFRPEVSYEMKPRPTLDVYFVFCIGGLLLCLRDTRY